MESGACLGPVNQPMISTMIRSSGCELLPQTCQWPLQSRGKAHPPLHSPAGAGRGCWDTLRGVKLVAKLGKRRWGRVPRRGHKDAIFSTYLWMFTPARCPQRLGIEEGSWDGGAHEG